MKLTCLALTLLLPLTLGLNYQEDDLVFDDITEETSPPPTVVTRHEVKTYKAKAYKKIRRFRGIPDGIAVVGQVFKLKIPKQAFSGNVDSYDIRGNNGKPLPYWIAFDDEASTILGVPSKKDEGQHRITVKAHGKNADTAEDNFTIRVVNGNHREIKKTNSQNRCDESEAQIVMTILLDARFDSLRPSVKVEAIENLAKFLRLDVNDLFMYAAGNVKRRKEKDSSVIEWQVGCDDHLWKNQSDILEQLRYQAKNGTLSKVVQLPVLLWRVKTDTSDLLRNRRETGSGDYGNNDDENDDDYDENYDYDGEDSFNDPDNERDNTDDNDNDNEAITEIPPRAHVPSASEPKGFLPSETEHPHRHHHGQETVDWETEERVKFDEILRASNPQENTINTTTSSAPRLTTTEQTSATQNSSPTPSIEPVTTTPKTPIQPATSTTTVADVPPPPPPPPKTSTITTTTSAESTTLNVTETFTTPGDIIQTELTQDNSTLINTIRAELETVLATISTDNDTLSSTELTTLPNSLGIVTWSTEKQDNNSTIYEITESTEASTSEKPSTQAPVTETRTPEPTTSTPSTTTTTTTTTPKPTTEEPTTTSTTTTTPSTTTASTTTTTKTTTTTTTTERFDFGIKNLPPRQDRRLKKIPVTAGKPLSFIIPSNTFSDIEDGDTRNLRLRLLLKGNPVRSGHWLQFNEKTQEVYGLPLENDVSQWEYDIVASDREGLTVSDSLDIYVQQHKFTKSINHEFSIYLEIVERSEFPTNVDWELKVVQRLAQLYGDTDSSHITVRSIEIENNQAIFTWANDSVPRSSECPKDEINKLLHVLIADKNENPSAMLQQILSPEIRVSRVVYQGHAQCDNMNQPEVPVVVPPELEKPKQATANRFPLPRNQVDQIDAMVGQLLVFRVPEDTFFDHEDGSSRNMRMSLLKIDRSEISPKDWLQFDSKNQEFYGVPLHEDYIRNNRMEYQLVVVDKEGAEAVDSLVVVIDVPEEEKQHLVDFSMTLHIPYDSFAHSAMQKRHFIERLRDLFGDKDTSAISLSSITPGSTVVNWKNITLPTNYCPDAEIKRLMEILVKPDKSLTDHVNEIMGKEFPVQQVTLTPLSICVGELTRVHTPGSYVPPSQDSTAVGSFQDDYLITFILPAVIIAAMILLAGIIAFILYRRRRSGKMSVSEHDDERQSFRSKGIPVIFQDELEEKPDPGNKSPVILKEEKPPLPPPEYQKSDDGADQPMLPKENSEEPYQPPPPFARTSDNNRQNRPKPTPTYRKPPPYVPP
ncbi:dystroglycan isoform X1 [Diachasma alloeum]|uniref:dystroglycan isoform X1 n=1 Tax=Diachasma alloeum TaxID=454923 RepID=UPI00073828F0|nr:dystroglycan isoform X1 [Diachasma alloeum]XP_015124761.1 dystroglycan isoform X1 [Diachasma alloeum]